MNNGTLWALVAFAAGFLGLAADLLRRQTLRRLMAENARLAEQLEKQSEAHAEDLARLRHSLRTPLATIKMNLEQFLADCGDINEAQKKCVERIDRALMRLKENIASPNVTARPEE